MANLASPQNISSANPLIANLFSAFANFENIEWTWCLLYTFHKINVKVLIYLVVFWTFSWKRFVCVEVLFIDCSEFFK